MATSFGEIFSAIIILGTFIWMSYVNNWFELNDLVNSRGTFAPGQDQGWSDGGDGSLIGGVLGGGGIVSMALAPITSLLPK